jgi:hypothetical protein
MQRRTFSKEPRLAAVIGVLTVAIAVAQAGECRLDHKNKATLIDGAIVYSSSVLNVDADGAPNSYRLDGQGLSYTCDGVAAIENGKRIKVGAPNWQTKCQSAWKDARASGDYSKVAIFGFATDSTGTPLIQKEGDPLPGEAFISATAVTVAAAPADTQRHYVDATAIPYIVLPVHMRPRIEDAAVAAVWRPKTNGLSFAIFADTGGALDEGSVRLHQDLGGRPFVKENGAFRAKRRIEDSILVAIFPAQQVKPRLDAENWRTEIESTGRAAFERWGGIAKLDQCWRQP